LVYYTQRETLLKTLEKALTSVATQHVKTMKSSYHKPSGRGTPCILDDEDLETGEAAVYGGEVQDGEDVK
jgi:hypothetical protein